MEPRSIPELVAARAAGGLAGEEFFEGLTFSDLADSGRVPAWMQFLHDGGAWEIECARGIAVLEPMTLLIAARAVARALVLHEQDRVAVVGDLYSPRLWLCGVAAALYAGAVLVDPESKPTVTISQNTVSVEGNPLLSVIGWPETCGLGAFSSQPLELGTMLDRMEADVVDGELAVRGPLVMAGYRHDSRATATAFAGGWFHTGNPASVNDSGAILFR